MGNMFRCTLKGGGSGTSITPSNSSPVSMTGGETYTPTTNGVAVESVTNLTPANTSPPSISTGNIYKPTTSGVAVESVTNLTPANASPPSISTGNIYKPTTSGQAIASIATNGSSVTPSSSGKYFYPGWNKMESSGYAYSSKPGESRTSLWSNSSPSSDFAGQTVSLSQSIANFKYIAIEYKASTSSSITIEILFTPTDLRKATVSNGNPLFALAGRYPNVFNERFFYYSSDTGISFSDARIYNSTTVKNSYAIPIKISGIN